ncbi:MAG: 3-oxoacyl-ACP synthase, partial [Xanthomonadales bacterium]|nr:3-oxoacyl-ACP synthase [Xanthomonadales bacterium]
MAKFANITGWGKCMPPAVMTNADMATVIDTTDEWIKSRSGISERRVSHVPVSDLAAVAGHRALAAAGLKPEDVDLLIVATCSPDTVIPATAAHVQKKMGLVNA